jgi:CBS domain-containing protein
VSFDDDDNDGDRLADEEQPGPDELESALTRDTLGDVVTQPAVSVEVGTTLSETIRRMQSDHRGYVAVLNGRKLVGIFTERDLLMRVAGQQLDPERTTVDAFMTRDPVTLPVDSSVAHALNLMVVEGFRHVPMVDNTGNLVAVATMRDLMEYLSDFFSRDILNLPPDPRVVFRTREGG